MAYFCFSAYLDERCRSTLAQTFPEHSLGFRIWTAKSKTTTCMIFHSFWVWLTLTSREIGTVHFSVFFVMRHLWEKWFPKWWDQNLLKHAAALISNGHLSFLPMETREQVCAAVPCPKVEVIGSLSLQTKPLRSCLGWCHSP